MKTKRILILGILLVVIVLLIPAIFTDRTEFATDGPGLSEVDHTEISFRNGDLELAGMLMVPEGEGPFPVAVFIHGSGTSHRDNRWYLSYAQHLQENGIAVLLPDKRGSENSDGDWRTASFEDLAGDTLSAVEFVKSQELFEYSYIGVIGMSQGGWIAPIVATESEDVSFVISISGAGVTTDEQLIYEEINSIVQIGTYRFIAQIIAPITVNSIKQQEFWALNSGFDPIPYWENVSVPAFAAFGGGDINVPVEESVRRLEGLDQLILIKVYPEGEHGIRDPNTHKVQAAVLNDMVDFIANAR
jgi:dipeptidyl aminopeptidase/acylaminoacyl peptidase